MRKSGLQKQISSIFTDAPMPQAVDPTSIRLPVQPSDDAARPNAPARKAPDMPSAASAPVPAAAPTRPADPAPSAQTPAVPARRPKPQPKVDYTPPKPKTSQVAAKQFKKVLFGSAQGMDSRQKKMTVLVGILMLVFGAVLVVSLGGAGKKNAKTPKPDAEQAPSASVKSRSPQPWQTPEPLPAQLRDPMIPQVPQTPTETVEPDEPEQMIVKGIVFSKTNPTAIIDGKIVRQGETVNGAAVVTIHRDAVEFEKDGRRWTQPVQP